MSFQTPFWPVDRNVSTRERLCLIPASSLTDDDRAAWDALAADAEPGAFFAHRWFLEPLLDAPRRVLAVVADGNRWVGAMGIEQANRLGRIPLPVWRGVNDANQFIGLPLVRSGMSKHFWRALVDGLERHRSPAIALHLPILPDDSPITTALLQWCSDDGRWHERLRQTERAAMSGEQRVGTDVWQSMSAARRRRLASLARQLQAAYGPIRITAASGLAQTAAWIDLFLKLERSGWKGVAQSAMAESALTDQLFRKAVAGAAAQGVAQCLTLYAGNTALAASVQFIDGTMGCGFKTAFDEEFARYAPGIQLLMHITTVISETPGLYFDSCSMPNQSSINELWPNRRKINDECIGFRGGGREYLLAALLSARRSWNKRTKP